MNWVKHVVAQHKENEAPERFFYWAALATLSATVKKNVYVNRHYYKLYPNIYVFLVAASGMKKSVPVTMAKNLLERVDCTRLIIGRSSIPAVIKDLGRAHPYKSGGVLKEAHGILLSGELAAFLVKDPDALTILTDLHDTQSYEKEWINNLKISGVDKLIAPCITLLGATNEEHFPDAVPPNAVGGGFIARTFIVLSHERGNLNSLTEAPKVTPDLDQLSEYLIKTSQVKGEMRWTKKAVEIYDAWYYPFMQEVKHDPTGTYNRIGEQVIKVATLLSLADSHDLVLKQEHIEEALVECLDCANGMKQVTMGQGRGGLSLQTKLVMRELLSQPDNKVERSKLLAKYWGEFDAFDLDKIIETLLGADVIRIEQAGKKRFYVMKQEHVQNYLQFKKKIQ